MRPQPQFACCLGGLSLLFAACCPAVAGLRPIQTQSCAQHDAEIAAGKPARRVALSIGVNSPKHGVNNAANDGQLMATTLRELGWEVSQAANVDRVSMLAAIAAFGNLVKTLCPSDVALFYFAGNGFEVNRVSYMGGADAAHERIKQSTSLDDQLSALDTFASTKDVLKALSEHQGQSSLSWTLAATIPSRSPVPTWSSWRPGRFPTTRSSLMRLSLATTRLTRAPIPILAHTLGHSAGLCASLKDLPKKCFVASGRTSSSFPPIPPFHSTSDRSWNQRSPRRST